MVQIPSFLDEIPHPAEIDHCSCKKEQENGDVVNSKYHTENQKVEYGEQNIQWLIGEQLFHPLVVPDPEHEIAGEFDIKKWNRKPHEFYQEFGYQADIDSRTEMEQDPAPDDLNYASSEKDK